MRFIYVARKSSWLINVIGYLLLTRKPQFLHKIGVRLRLFFEDLGGVYIKFGQILALRRDILPDQICDELSKLLEEVPPIKYESVEKIIKKDFGIDVSEIFAQFEQKPFAAASIGQVHKAKLKTGEDVVVKVKRPEIDEVVDADLRILTRLTVFVDFFVFFINIKLHSLAKEFSVWIYEELDYRNEARNLHEFSEFKTDIIPIFNIPLKTRVPKLYPNLSSENVITMEFIKGQTVNSLIKARRSVDKNKYNELISHGYDYKTIGRQLNLVFQKQIFIDGFFNADTHPANIIVTSDNEIVAIDLGLVGRLSEKQRVLIFRFGRAVGLLNKEAAINSFIGLMKVQSHQRNKVEKAIGELIDKLIMYRQESSAKYANVSYQSMLGLLKSMNDLGVQIPPEIAKALRTVLTGDSIVSALNPDISTEEVLQDMYKISLASSYLLLKSKVNKKSIQKLLIKTLDFLDYELSAL